VAEDKEKKIQKGFYMNTLYKALIYDRQVSLSVFQTTKLVNDAIQTHHLKGQEAVTLGNLLGCCVYMAGCLKSDKGAISITVKAGEDSSTVSVSGDKNLHIRGYIDGGGALKGGTMTVIKDDGFSRPFIGTIALPCDDVSEDLMQYFHQSEQIPTAVAVGVKLNDDGSCKVAGGVVMQLLPGTSEENMDKAEQKMQSFVNVCDVLEKYGAQGIIEELFRDECDRQYIYQTFPSYKCNCSRKKISGVLLSMGKAELLDIIKEQGKVSVHCHYCNTDYDFYKEDIEKLFP
jgi:molecular chaperone Hsp33